MSTLKTVFLFLLALSFTACVDDEDMLPALADVAAPSALDLEFDVAADNSGNVTIQPIGEGVTRFRLDFGDGTVDSTGMTPGATVIHNYARGTYTVSLEAMGINGKTTSYTEELTVEFAAPRNLVATIERDPGNPFTIIVSASAELASSFEVTFGEDVDAEPQVFEAGGSIQYTYSSIGEYEVCIVARNGGTTTIKTTETVVIADPTVLPIDFEGRDTEFFGFGGAIFSVIDNPDVSDGNGSSRVAQVVKTDGAETFAGTVVTLGGPLSFDGQNIITLKTWSPVAGLPVLLKLENATNDQVFIESTVNTTVANEWETLSFDFSAGDLTLDYSKVIIFFGFGEAGSNQTFYFDDIRQSDGSAAITLPLGFEGDVEYAFEGFGGGSASVIDNPDVSAGNGSARVVEFIKASGSMTWGGVFTDVDDPIDFSGTQTVKLKVWSPKVGAQILLKFENAENSDINREVMVPTTVANQWEELTFDFSGAETLSNLSRIVLFADFDVEGAGQPYYFDDLRLE